MLAGTAQRRAAQACELQRQASTVDLRLLAARLTVARLLPLLGSRLVAAAPLAVSADFRDAVEAAIVHGRRRAALVEQLTLRLARALEDDGIRAVALKGPHLAERLHGDAAMRSSNDIDLLVQPEDFHGAVRVLAQTGYRSEDKAPWIDGLPLFEASLRPEHTWAPPIDLHWRLHWYEESFSRQFIRRAEPDERGIRAPRPLDELAALLLFWSRDGLAGARHASDVAAWWDRHGAELAPRALEEIAVAHPQLRPALTTAALHAERMVGLPAARLLDRVDLVPARLRLASRWAIAARPVSQAQLDAGVVLTDALLTPRGGRTAFLRRHLVLPEAVIGDVYDLPERARVRRAARRVYYAARVGASLGAG
ncbi:MAG: nucleotidyltransferase family protein, partial [Actinomycetota bacterium]|nr:nucleotidyltransferase family protein [Actinomycetota bacterium]